MHFSEDVEPTEISPAFNSPDTCMWKLIWFLLEILKERGEGRGFIYKGETCSKERAAIQEWENRDQHSQDLARCEVSNWNQEGGTKKKKKKKTGFCIQMWDENMWQCKVLNV